ncbi:MAG: hypothetical protein K0Q69_2485, partial [Devosia sp.]|nr:hypothetical protein [Devosia sp.]
MTDNSDGIGRWLFIGCCVGAAVVLIANGLTCEATRCQSFWIGSTGYIGALVSIGTFVAVVAAGVVAWRSYKTNQEVAAATRFQKAVDLIGSQSSSASIGGIWSALDVAKQFPERYLAPTFKCLQAFIKEGSEDIRRRVDREYPTWQRHWPATESKQVQALIACTHVPTADRWPDAIDYEGETEVYGGYLARVAFSGLNFHRLNLRDFVMCDVTFVNCDFRECEISGRLQGNVIFRQCDLTGAAFDVTDMSGKTFGQWA